MVAQSGGEAEGKNRGLRLLEKRKNQTYSAAPDGKAFY
jgi:hypothetical protein